LFEEGMGEERAIIYSESEQTCNSYNYAAVSIDHEKEIVMMKNQRNTANLVHSEQS